MEEKYEEGFSLSEMFKIIWSRKIWIIGVTLAILIVGVLGVKYVINSSRELYYTTVEYKFPGIENGTYPDGTPFDYRNIVSLEALKKVQASSEEYNSIDVEIINGRNHARINQVEKKVDNKTVILPHTYKFEIGATQFSDEKIAKRFIVDLINLPIKESIVKIRNQNYFLNLETSNSALQYEYQINLLNSQKVIIQTGYDGILATQGDIEFDDKKISDYKMEIDKYFVDYDIEYLLMELEHKGYVKNMNEYKERLNLEKDNLQKEKTRNQKLRENLTAQLTELVKIYGNNNSQIIQTFEEFNKVIVDTVKRDIEIDKRLEEIAIKLNNTLSTAETQLFEAKINEFYDQLNEFTKGYEKISKTVKELNTKLAYVDGYVLRYDGGISLIIAVLLFGFVGFTSSCVFFIAFDKDKQKKLKNNKVIL